MFIRKVGAVLVIFALVNIWSRKFLSSFKDAIAEASWALWETKVP